MPREKYQTLTEQMFYILLALRQELCGADVMALVKRWTNGRVTIGPGTLYSLLEDFVKQGFIRETGNTGRRRTYVITEAGQEKLDREVERIRHQMEDYERYGKGDLTNAA